MSSKPRFWLVDEEKEHSILDSKVGPMNYELVLIICLGGVHLTKEPSEAGKLVQAMVGNRLTTKQTPPEGVEVQKVMIAHVCTNLLPAYKFQAIIRLN